MPRQTKVAVLLIQGDFEVHKSGCQDIKRSMSKAGNYFTEPVTPGVTTEYDMVLSLWADQIDEAVGPAPDYHYQTEAQAVETSFRHAVKFHGCLKGLVLPFALPDEPKPEPRRKAAPRRDVKAVTERAKRDEPKPKPAPAANGNGKLTREQKQQLADAVVAAAAKLLVNVSTRPDGDPEVVGQTIAQWLHHLPVNRDNWPAELPKPQRSDWA